MTIYSVYDAAFAPYGRVVEGYPTGGILEALATTPCPENVAYVPMVECLHAAKDAEAIGEALYGGMPFQLGYCNGHNTKLNCLEYHRDSEFDLGVHDFIAILGLQREIENGFFDTSKAKAFRVPAGVMIEVFATTLHYSPCHTNADEGFQVLIALPWLTNTDRPEIEIRNWEDSMMTARNKWLLPHTESSEAKGGAKVGLVGENIDIAPYLD